MDKPAVGKIHVREKVLSCPRDKAHMRTTETGQATLDVCGKCGGQYFDSGEMFAAFGIKADPSYWDRPETGGTVKTSTLSCPVCHATMLAQDVRYDGKHVEIDRCGGCGGIWLDKGEVETIMAIGEGVRPVVEAEMAQAKKDLAAMGDVSFASPSLIAKFLGLFKKKS
jgi:Zn-finger nucleic acid-binding protein